MSSEEMFSSGGRPIRGGPKAANPTCPKCAGRMIVKQVAPVLFASDLDDVIFGCEKCASEVKRTVKRA